MAFDYDLFVIGGGSGGVRAARVSAQLGARVGLAEEYRMGGTCVIRGCVPKKLMVFASAYPDAIEDARAYGWQAEAGSFDWTAFKGKLHAELDRLEGLYRANAQKAGVTIHDARAMLVGPQRVRLASGEEFTAERILVATGGRPFVPGKWADLPVLTSNEIFHLEALPESILIIGGGFIACEFACILSGLGVKVTQFYRGAQILRGFDGEARGHLAEMMRERGIDLHVGTDPVEIEEAPGGLRVKDTGGHEQVFAQVMFATGRVPNTQDMGLEDAGVVLGRRGEIVVDEQSRTSAPGIHAVGDVTDRINLTPVAIREGQAFAEAVFGGKPVTADHELVASAVFTRPELGTIGLTEEEVRENEAVDIYAASFRAMHSAFAGRSDRVLMKLVVSRATQKVLGCHIVADNAGEMIQLAAIAIKMGATKADFDRTVAVHPTMAEELVTMKVPVRTFP
ncbi:glutathione-disulfide reductase [Alkalilacustris brevis]|uniref:glutathione-disulfide reductase n=1 Tax=Alkalilacustris brevis TaxID=2026338 RepID=UPI000E0DC44B|nr:glutathione-disulfide reductase [Alkalilacustris brevis]